MQDSVHTDYPGKPKRWYNSDIFPLIPQLTIRKANKHNTKSISFHWLFFQFWTLDCFQLELSFVISDHWGIGFIGILPYLRFVFTIPCPEKLGRFISKHLDRKPKI